MGKTTRSVDGAVSSVARKRSPRAGRYQEEWNKIVAAYKMHPYDFYSCWSYLYRHPIFSTLDGTSYFNMVVCVDVIKVDPETREISECVYLNTLTQVWIEIGPVYLKEDAPASVWERPGMKESADQRGVVSNVHDINLDSGGDTYEDAIIKLAANVSKLYGNDRRLVYS